MQDRLSSAFDLSGVSITIPDTDFHTADAIRPGEPQVIRSRRLGGSAITLQSGPHSISLKGNPIGFLTGQNVYGPCDMPALNLALFRELRDMGVLAFDTAGWNRIEAGDYAVSELAFAQYMQCDPVRKTDQVSHMHMLYTSVIPDWDGHSIHAYAGCGFIVRRRNMSLTVYDKVTEVESHRRGAGAAYSTRYTGDIDRTLADKLRVETTLKYNWLQGRSLLRADAWTRRVERDHDGDWSAAARVIVIEGIEQFRLPYLLSCPNVFHDSFYSGLDSRTAALYRTWLAGRGATLQASERRALADAGLWAEIGPARHRQLLWQRMFPGADVPALLNGRTASTDRLAEAFNSRVLPLDPLCGALLPLDRTIRGSGPRRRLTRIRRRLALPV